MPKVAHAREHYGEARFIGGFDHLVVAHRSAGLDHGGWRGPGDDVKAHLRRAPAAARQRKPGWRKSNAGGRLCRRC
jgi:hypothetical protein